MITAKNDLDFVTASIQDASQKPHLRPVIASALETMGHDQHEIKEALDQLYIARSIQ
jgi:Holliday junction resolvasome RuvABC DNA-binding subunit